MRGQRQKQEGRVSVNSGHDPWSQIALTLLKILGQLNKTPCVYQQLTFSHKSLLSNSFAQQDVYKNREGQLLK